MALKVPWDCPGIAMGLTQKEGSPCWHGTGMMRVNIVLLADNVQGAASFESFVMIGCNFAADRQQAIFSSI